MTWAEFQIRSYAYLRIQERDDLRAREIAWASLMAFNVDPKTLPKSKERYWRIGKQEPILTDTRKTAILKAQKEYLNKINKE